MNCSVLVYRILASALLALLALLAVYGRVVERAVSPYFPSQATLLVALVSLCAVGLLTGRGALRTARSVSLVKAASGGLLVLIVLWLVQSPAEWVHVGSYFLLAFALSNGGWVRGILRAGALCALIGIGDELLQSTQPTRVPDPWDVVLDAVGAILGAIVASLGCQSNCGEPLKDTRESADIDSR